MTVETVKSVGSPAQVPPVETGDGVAPVRWEGLPRRRLSEIFKGDFFRASDLAGLFGRKKTLRYLGNAGLTSGTVLPRSAALALAENICSFDQNWTTKPLSRDMARGDLARHDLDPDLADAWSTLSRHNWVLNRKLSRAESIAFITLRGLEINMKRRRITQVNTSLDDEELSKLRNGELQVQSPVENGPLCRHHWLIETPNGTLSMGRCKICGDEREFRNSPADYLWENPEESNTPWRGTRSSLSEPHDDEND